MLSHGLTILAPELSGEFNDAERLYILNFVMNDCDSRAALGGKTVNVPGSGDSRIRSRRCGGIRNRSFAALLGSQDWRNAGIFD